MSKHTPGPWVEYGSAVLGPEPQNVDFSRFRGFDDDNGGLGYVIAESIPHAPTRRLIAAAPDLLEVARKFRSAMTAAFNAGTEEREGGSANRQAKYQAQCEEILAECRAAIAKAEGADNAAR